MIRRRQLLIFSAVFGLGFFAAGCPSKPDSSQQSKAPADSKSKKADEEHGHKPGAHNGIIVAIGQDSYHAEAVFEKNGVLRLYTLGQDESRVLEVDAQPIEAFVRAEGDTEAEAFVMRPEPQTGDAKGKTSLFLGQLPREKWGKKVDVTITNFRIGTERFRLGFSNVVESASHGDPMPKGVAADEEKKLYLEPGGIYTLADIKANGNMTASQKFKGFRAVHDMNPKVGDKICPITDTLANPKCAWVVNGKTYEFCCPPCVDEFVARAKTDPGSILAPEEYVKKARDQGAKTGSVLPVTSKTTPIDSSENLIQAERAKLSPEDRILVDAQEWCVIQTDERLGSVGAPLKLMINNQPVYVCCKGCQRQALAAPEQTLAKVEELKTKRKAATSKK